MQHLKRIKVFTASHKYQKIRNYFLKYSVIVQDLNKKIQPSKTL